MNPREQRLVLLLGACIVLALLLGGGYFGFYAPWSDKNEQADKLASTIIEREGKLTQMRRELPRVQATLSRSLPSDFDIARQEYDAALYKMLEDAKVPSSSLSIKPRAADSKSGIPEINKRPAYQKVVFEVTIDKISYGTILDVLSRYYNLNLLHQITKLNIKKSQDSANIRRIGSSLSDRPDLNLTLVTEAIIMDGAENRATLYPIPPGLGLLGGGAGLQIINFTPEVGRQMKPLMFVSALAEADRNYQLLLVKDVFHGAPPPPPPPPKKEVPPPEPPKEDTSPFIRLTGLGRNQDGTGSAVIEDVAAKYEYTITVTWDEGKLSPSASKVYFLKGNRKKESMDVSEGMIEISDTSSSVSRKFKIVGFDTDSLILLGSGSSSPAPKGGIPSKGFSSRTPPRAPASAALIGGIIVAIPQEKVYAWKHGEALNKLRELSGSEGLKAIQRAKSSTSTATETAPPAASPAPAPAKTTGL